MLDISQMLCLLLGLQRQVQLLELGLSLLLLRL